MKERLGIITLFVVIFVAFILIWNFSYQKSQEDIYIPIEKGSTGVFIPSEGKVFERSDYALDYVDMPIEEKYQRSLDTYYDNRAYPGAPPSIPHPVIQEQTIGGKACLQCHQNGGFVKKFDAYAPVTPHPEMINCRQCHVSEVQTRGIASNFHKVTPPAVGTGANNALPGSPPMIPHQLQMRENCLSCHAGPAAPKEIRVTHPERINCRQCHLPAVDEAGDLGVYLRQFSQNEK